MKIAGRVTSALNRIWGKILKLKELNNRKANEKRIKFNLDKNSKNECKYKFNKMRRKIYYQRS